MGDDGPSNWRRATETPAMMVLVRDLVAIGVTLGPDTAERIYRALHEEPRTDRGDRIDWTTILREIQQQAQRATRTV